MVKDLRLEDMLVGSAYKDYYGTLTITPLEEYNLSNETIANLESYLKVQTNPRCEWLDFEDVAAEVILTAFSIGYMYGGRAMKDGKFNTMQNTSD